MITAQTSVLIAEESFADTWKDIQPLLFTHWREITAHHDIPLSPDLPAYERMAAAGTLCIVTARRDGRLVGYAVFFVGPNPHYSTSVQAVQDIFYVDPSVRGARLGIRLIAASDAILRQRGCQVVYHHVKCAHPLLGALLTKRGYGLTETLYSKRLDQE